ncbi:glycosyltransferase family 2 protein [Patescibacteria group bacterium]|nr:glycosyltransferase family 2 protein [Patescibacteria group bacterium]
MIQKFVEKHDRLVHRSLEIILGVLTWSLLTSPIWLGLLYPPAIVYMLTFLTVYWTYMAYSHSKGLFVGYRIYQEEMSFDWYLECRKLDYFSLPEKETLPPTLEDVRHILVIPVVNEPKAVLKDSIDSILNQSFPISQICLVFTVEQKYSNEVIERIRNVVGEREKNLSDLMFFIHPAGIPGEAIGDGGANRAWGTSHAVEELKNKNENLRNYIFSNLDSDHVLHAHYLSRLTHLYLTTDKRDNHFYSSAVPLFDNNLWRVPLMMRLEANAVTLGVISDWTVSKGGVRKCFSAFSVSLQTLIDANYFDVSLGADDTIFYWRAFFARNGEFEGRAHFIPYSADAVEGKNYLDSYKSLYKQLLRWGWGVVDFPLSVKGFLKKSEIKTSKKIKWMVRHMKERVLLVNIVFLITFGFAIVTLVNPYVKQSSFAYSLPKITSLILTLTLVFMIPGVYFRKKFSVPPPEKWSKFRRFLTYLEGPLIMLNLLTYSFFPWIHAQTMLIFGKRFKDLYHTPKVR